MCVCGLSRVCVICLVCVCVCGLSRVCPHVCDGVLSEVVEGVRPPQRPHLHTPVVQGRVHTAATAWVDVRGEEEEEEKKKKKKKKKKKRERRKKKERKRKKYCGKISR